MKCGRCFTSLRWLFIVFFSLLSLSQNVDVSGKIIISTVSLGCWFLLLVNFRSLSSLKKRSSMRHMCRCSFPCLQAIAIQPVVLHRFSCFLYCSSCYCYWLFSDFHSCVFSLFFFIYCFFLFRFFFCVAAFSSTEVFVYSSLSSLLFKMFFINFFLLFFIVFSKCISNTWSMFTLQILDFMKKNEDIIS